MYIGTRFEIQDILTDFHQTRETIDRATAEVIREWGWGWADINAKLARASIHVSNIAIDRITAALEVKNGMEY